ncbi:hypothetical protein [Aliihoeflea sp. 40Bstr573]|uniref:hypothetical protein n=1 Tax=Aliihoeflea sp. 40Bstr573 TaxID=2696467 RepID=UPI0020957F66|nr:hypothetical protein [Aliihoeflea sp. 40Bstr573]MCO6388982.1 hypothetical protein [Aliihoeflea sp. 40Bstr573]
MSTSDRPNRFDAWLSGEYRSRGDFTMLVVLVVIDGTKITLLRSTFMNVIGDETHWVELRELLAGSGAPWNGAAFFPLSPFFAGPVSNDIARQELRALEERLREDRRVLNEGHFFDRKGRRLKVDELVH